MAGLLDYLNQYAQYNQPAAAPAIPEGMSVNQQALQNAYNFLYGHIDQKDRIKKLNNFSSSNPDIQARLNYALSIADPNDVQRYNDYVQQNPWTVQTPTDPTKAEEPAVVDPNKMALAKTAAMQRAELNLRAQGLDPALYMDKIGAEYDKRAQTASLLSDPYSAFGDDVATNVVKAENSQRQNQFMQDYESKFGISADQAALPTTMLDDAINKIMAEQKTAAQTQLERGKARGIYNDVGYNAGQQALGTAEGAGKAELGNLGAGLLDQYRGNLNAIDDKAFSAYQSYPIGSSSFNLDPYIAERNDYIGRTQGRAEGDLRSSLGGRNFFDFGKIGGAAGTAQGALNLKDADVATALGERKRLNTQSRGLGSQGAF